MTTKASMRYQLADGRKAMLIYYLVMGLLFVLLAVLFATVLNNGAVMDGTQSDGTEIYGMQSTGTVIYSANVSFSDGASLIFLFVVGLCSFKETFFMLTQNGVSRRSVFLGRMAATGIIAAIMAVADLCLGALTGLLVRMAEGVQAVSAFDMAYQVSGVYRLVSYFGYLLASYLLAFAAGYFITILYYRMNTALKIIVSVAAPLLLFIGLPLAEYFITDGRMTLTNALARAGNFLMGIDGNMPWMAVLTYLVATAVVLLLCWLLLRKAQVKQNIK